MMNDSCGGFAFYILPSHSHIITLLLHDDEGIKTFRIKYRSLLFVCACNARLFSADLDDTATREGNETKQIGATSACRSRGGSKEEKVLSQLIRPVGRFLSLPLLLLLHQTVFFLFLAPFSLDKNSAYSSYATRRGICWCHSSTCCSTCCFVTKGMLAYTGCSLYMYYYFGLLCCFFFIEMCFLFHFFSTAD